MPLLKGSQEACHLPGIHTRQILDNYQTTIAVDLDMPLRVVQRIKHTWFIKRSRITLEPTVKQGEERNGNLQAGA